MSISIEMITDAAMSLSSDARALLADRLVESLDPLTDLEIRAAWAEEALRRLAEVRTGKVSAIPAEQVLDRVRSLIR
jgi:putative addiction module component (TIGR02574 family)